MGALADELAANREALLAVVSGMDASALSLPTRNAEWSVHDVLAHVLASDVSLMALLEGATEGRIPDAPLDAYDEDRAAWREAGLSTMVQQLIERGERWRELFAALPDHALDGPAHAWWMDGSTTLGAILEDYRTHDGEHGEDVRLAMEEAGRD